MGLFYGVFYGRVCDKGRKVFADSYTHIVAKYAKYSRDVSEGFRSWMDVSEKNLQNLFDKMGIYKARVTLRGRLTDFWVPS